MSDTTTSLEVHEAQYSVKQVVERTIEKLYVYFPQWQGAGQAGSPMKTGAATILQHLGQISTKFTHIELSDPHVAQPVNAQSKADIHCYAALVEQLQRYRRLLEEKLPSTVHTLGGDCGVDIIPVSYLNRQLVASGQGKLGVLWFDAHADINLPEESPSQNFHGMPVRTLLGEGAADMVALTFSKLAPDQVVYIGTRDLDPPEEKYVAAHNITLLKTLDVAELLSVLNEKGVTHVYIHLDLDCLDPAEYSHTYYKVDHGLSVENVHSALQMLASSFKIVGYSLLESVAKHPEELAPIQKLIDFFVK